MRGRRPTDAGDNELRDLESPDDHYWPALHFADADGSIRDHHFGAGRYEQSERVIQPLLGVERELASLTGSRGDGYGCHGH